MPLYICIQKPPKEDAPLVLFLATSDSILANHRARRMAYDGALPVEVWQVEDGARPVLVLALSGPADAYR